MGKPVSVKLSLRTFVTGRNDDENIDRGPTDPIDPMLLLTRGISFKLLSQVSLKLEGNRKQKHLEEEVRVEGFY